MASWIHTFEIKFIVRCQFSRPWNKMIHLIWLIWYESYQMLTDTARRINNKFIINISLRTLILQFLKFNIHDVIPADCKHICYGFQQLFLLLWGCWNWVLVLYSELIFENIHRDDVIITSWWRKQSVRTLKIPDEGEKDYGRHTRIGFRLIKNKIWPVHIFWFHWK